MGEGRQLNYNFDTAGNYTVILTVTDDQGDVWQYSDIVRVSGNTDTGSDDGAGGDNSEDEQDEEEEYDSEENEEGIEKQGVPLGFFDYLRMWLIDKKIDFFEFIQISIAMFIDG